MLPTRSSAGDVWSQSTSKVIFLYHKQQQYWRHYRQIEENASNDYINDSNDNIDNSNINDSK